VVRVICLVAPVGPQLDLTLIRPPVETGAEVGAAALVEEVFFFAARLLVVSVVLDLEVLLGQRLPEPEALLSKPISRLVARLAKRL